MRDARPFQQSKPVCEEACRQERRRVDASGRTTAPEVYRPMTWAADRRFARPFHGRSEDQVIGCPDAVASGNQRAPASRAKKNGTTPFPTGSRDVRGSCMCGEDWTLGRAAPMTRGWSTFGGDRAIGCTATAAGARHGRLRSKTRSAGRGARQRTLKACRSRVTVAHLSAVLLRWRRWRRRSCRRVPGAWWGAIRSRSKGRGRPAPPR